MSDKKNDDAVIALSEYVSSGPREPATTATGFDHHQPGALTMAAISNSPGASILAYCLASISMTVVNKYVVSGTSWNMNFLYLAIQVSNIFQNALHSGVCC